MLGGELPKRVSVVVADREGLDPVVFEGFQVLLQLDELRPAKASPGGAAVEQDEGVIPAPGLGEADQAPGLVDQLKVREGLADCWPLRKVLV